MLFSKYPKQGIFLLASFGRVMKYPSKLHYICYGTQCIYGPKRGIVSLLNSFGYEQYPSNSVHPCVHPWCLIIKYLNEAIGFLVGFGVIM